MQGHTNYYSIHVSWNSEHNTYEETRASRGARLTAFLNKAGRENFTGRAVTEGYLSLLENLLTALFRNINKLSVKEKQNFSLVFKALIHSLQIISIPSLLLVFLWPALHRHSRWQIWPELHRQYDLYFIDIADGQKLVICPLSLTLAHIGMKAICS